MDFKTLQDEYLSKQASLDRFMKAMREQLLELFDGESLALGLPIEARVKTWLSIEEKLRRRSLTPSSLVELTDLVGLRAIFLFRRDLDKATAAVSRTFVVVTQEDTGERLGESSFGYQSLHLIVRAPKEWQSLPALRGCQDFTVELQLRTLAQHLWAASSHKLQYKQETGVPLGEVQLAVESQWRLGGHIYAAFVRGST